MHRISLAQVHACYVHYNVIFKVCICSVPDPCQIRVFVTHVGYVYLQSKLPIRRNSVNLEIQFAYRVHARGAQEYSFADNSSPDPFAEFHYDPNCL